MTNASILIVEDEPNLGATLKEYLETIGHQASLATTVQMGAELFRKNHPQVVLMDIELPDGNGMDLAKSLRDIRKDFVLFFLSAQNDPNTRVSGLEIGAQDYITKPFELKELTLRLKRVLALQEDLFSQDTIRIGPLEILFKNYELKDAQGLLIPLSQKECAILQLLYSKEGQVVDRDQIIDYAWGKDENPSHRTVDNYIVKLRKWSETDPEKSLEILSVRGEGYKLTLKKD